MRRARIAIQETQRVDDAVISVLHDSFGVRGDRLSPVGSLRHACGGENFVLEASDGGAQRLPAPVRGDEATISGDGWTFKAGAGWVVREGARRGDYEAVRQQR